MIFGQNLAIYTVLYKESESEVKNIKILEPGGNKLRKTNAKSKYPISLFYLTFFNLNVGLVQESRVCKTCVCTRVPCLDT